MEVHKDTGCYGRYFVETSSGSDQRFSELWGVVSYDCGTGFLGEVA